MSYPASATNMKSLCVGPESGASLGRQLPERALEASLISAELIGKGLRRPGTSRLLRRGHLLGNFHHEHEPD